MLKSCLSLAKLNVSMMVSIVLRVRGQINKGSYDVFEICTETLSVLDCAKYK